MRDLGEEFVVCLVVSAGASLPYLGVFLWLAPRNRSFGSQQALHFGLALLTLLGLLPFFGGFALFMAPYWPIGVVCHALMRGRPPEVVAASTEQGPVA
jgi:hypothetical protein